MPEDNGLRTTLAGEVRPGDVVWHGDHWAVCVDRWRGGPLVRLALGGLLALYTVDRPLVTLT